MKYVLQNNGQQGCAYYPTAPEWVAGSEYSFAELSAAYSEWQGHVRSPVAPKPTAIGSLGEILKKAGLFQKSTYVSKKHIQRVKIHPPERRNGAA